MSNYERLNRNQPVPIFFTCDENDAIYLSIALVSICENTTSPVDFYVLCYEVSKAFKDKAEQVIAQYKDKTIRFIEVDVPEKIQNLPYSLKKSQISYLAPTINTDLNKIICLDVRVCVELDIVELYNEDLGENIIGAVYDRSEFGSFWYNLNKSLVSYYHEYFDTSVLLIDAKKWREDDITSKLQNQIFESLTLIDSTELSLLNICFQTNKYQKLPDKYNYIYPKNNYVKEAVKSDYEEIRILNYKTLRPKDFLNGVLYDSAFWKYIEKIPYIESQMEALGWLKELNTPVFSIIVPVYNPGGFLKHCLESILAQTFANFELICVDDGSYDGSIDVLKKYAKDDSRIRIFSQYKKGVSVARNVGLNLARGQYICFVDSDDIIEPNLLSLTHKKMLEDDADIVEFGMGFIGNWLQVKPEKLEKNLSLRERCHKLPFVESCANRIFKKEFINKNKIRFLEKIDSFEDSIFLWMCKCKKPKVSQLLDILYLYRRGVYMQVTNITTEDANITAIKKLLKTPQFKEASFDMQLQILTTCLWNIDSFKYFKDENLCYIAIHKLNRFKSYLEKQIPKELLAECASYQKMIESLEQCTPSFEKKWLNFDSGGLYLFETSTNFKKEPGSVLIIEPNIASKLESVPYLVKFFMDKGFYVDLVVSPHQMELNPIQFLGSWNRFKQEDASLWALDTTLLPFILESDKMDVYKYIIFNSSFDEYDNKSIFEMGSSLVNLRDKVYVKEQQPNALSAKILGASHVFDESMYDILENVFDVDVDVEK